MTMVPRLSASSLQSRAGPGLAGSSLPVRIVTCEAYLPVGERDADRCRDGEGARYARHHLDRDPGGADRLHLLPAAAEEERVAALEPDHNLSLPCPVHQQGLDLVLLERVAAAVLAAVDLLGPGRERGEDLFPGQLVEEHDIGHVDHVPPAPGEEPFAARAGPDKVHFTIHA